MKPLRVDRNKTKTHFWAGIVETTITPKEPPSILTVGDRWKYDASNFTFEVVRVEPVKGDHEVFSVTTMRGEEIHTRELWSSLVRNADWWSKVV